MLGLLHAWMLTVGWWCVSDGWGRRARIIAAAPHVPSLTAWTALGDDWPLHRADVPVERRASVALLAEAVAGADPDVLVVDGAACPTRRHLGPVVEDRRRRGRRTVAVWRWTPDCGGPLLDHVDDIVAVEPGCLLPHRLVAPVLVRDDVPDPTVQRTRLGGSPDRPLILAVGSVWDPDGLPGRVAAAAPAGVDVAVLDRREHWPAVDWLAAADLVVAHAGWAITTETTALGVPAVLIAGRPDQATRATHTWLDLPAALAAVQRRPITLPDFTNRARDLAAAVLPTTQATAHAS